MGGAVSDVFDTIGGAVSDAVDTVGGFVEDTANFVADNPAVLLAAAVAVPALAGMASATAATGAAAGTAAATTSSTMLAAQSAELIAAGFSAADVAVSLAGLGEAAAIESVLVGAGVDALTAASLASETVLSDVALSNAAAAASSAEGQVAAQVAQAQLTPLAPQPPITSTPLPPIETAVTPQMPPAEFTLPTVDATSLETIPFDYGLEPLSSPTDFMLEGATSPEVGLQQPGDWGLGGYDAGNVPAGFDPNSVANYNDFNGFSSDYFSNLGNTGTVSGNLAGVIDPTGVLSLPSGFTGNILGTIPTGNYTPLLPVEGLPVELGGTAPYELPVETELQQLAGPGIDAASGLSLSGLGQGLQSLSNILGPGLGGSGGGGIGGGAAPNYEGIMSQLDPYWGYRKNTEIPMMSAAAGAAGSLSGLYQQSFTDPLRAYNTPEMQALNAQFMGDIERKDAAAGRMSQYGARDVQAQNQYLTNTLPAYRQNLQQGLGTLYNAAKTTAPDPNATYKALTDAQAAANRQRDAAQGTLSGAVSNLRGSWNQMTGSNNVFDQVTGAVNTASNVADLYSTGTKAFGALSNMFSF